MNNIFISYRRADSADVVGRIYDYLEGIVGKDNIFKDVHSVQLGVDYLEYTADTLSNCDVQLAIIGHEWLKGRRIDNPDDLVRVEIETAMQRDIPVIPVLVGGAVMPTQDELPDSLKPLAYRNAIQVRPDPDFPTDMARLVDALKGIVPLESKSTKPNRSPVGRWLPWVAGILIAAGVLWYFVSSKSSEDAPSQVDAAAGLSRSSPAQNTASAAEQDPAKVDRAMEFVDRYSADSLLEARARVSEATANAMDSIAGVLRNPDLTELELEQAYRDTILEMVAQESLSGSLEQLFNFYEQVLTCYEMKLCDEQVLTGFFESDAGGFSRTFYPWVCQVRADWNNPAAFERVLDFYLEGDSATVCDS
jgi:hypothetical protein